MSRKTASHTLFGIFFVLWVVLNGSAVSAGAVNTPANFAGFARIGEGGFGDSANSYSWTVLPFKGGLYVGTNRHHLDSMIDALSYLLGSGSPMPPGMVPPDALLPDPPPGEWFSTDWAQAMQGEIWRYTPQSKWEKVHQSGIYSIGEGKYAPFEYGYRALAEFDGYLYACGVGTWMPPIPTNTILRSKSGDPGDWEDVSGDIKLTNNIRAITAWKGKLYVAVSEGDPLSPQGTKAVVFASANPKTDGWHRVSIPGFGGNNSEIYSLAVFDEHLYASTVNLVTGFEVWKTIGDADSDDLEFGQELYVWTPVIRNGFGDTWNQYGMSMAAFGEHLYLGTAVGIGMVMKNGEVVGTKPLEIIRIGKNDEAELIVGARKASDPIDGGPSPRTPRSGIGAGFGNPFNVYAWDMNVYENCLYVGTFDTTVFILGALQGNPELLRLFMSLYPTRDLRFPTSINAALTSGRFTPTVLALLDRQFSGGDLWKSCDGVVWRPVTLNGFGNPLNYGIREVTPIQGNGRDVALAVGTANPFTGKPNGGCEVWLNGTLPEYELQR